MMPRVSKGSRGGLEGYLLWVRGGIRAHDAACEHVEKQGAQPRADAHHRHELRLDLVDGVHILAGNLRSRQSVGQLVSRPVSQ
eukprot:7577086-Pyramimonas_sp.AAC.1